MEFRKRAKVDKDYLENLTKEDEERLRKSYYNDETGYYEQRSEKKVSKKKLNS